MYLQASLGPDPAFPTRGPPLGLRRRGAALRRLSALGVLFTGLLSDRPTRLLGRRTTLWGGRDGGRCEGFSRRDQRRDESLCHPRDPVAGGSLLAQRVPRWCSELLFAAVLLAAIFIFLGHAPFPSGKPAVGPGDHREGDDGGGGSRILPTVFWGWCAVIFCASVEWSVAYWGASFLEGEAGLETADAATLMGACFVALLSGSRPCSRSPRSRARRASSSRGLGSATSTLWASPLRPARCPGWPTSPPQGSR